MYAIIYLILNKRLNYRKYISIQSTYYRDDNVLEMVSMVESSSIIVKLVRCLPTMTSHEFDNILDTELWSTLLSANSDAKQSRTT